MVKCFHCGLDPFNKPSKPQVIDEKLVKKFMKIVSRYNKASKIENEMYLDRDSSGKWEKTKKYKKTTQIMKDCSKLFLKEFRSYIPMEARKGFDLCWYDTGYTDEDVREMALEWLYNI